MMPGDPVQDFVTQLAAQLAGGVLTGAWERVNWA